MKYLSLLLVVIFFSCDPNLTDENSQVSAYVPVYLVQRSDTAINTEGPQPTVNPGKIYAYSNYLFQVEQNEGIHIIDNHNPQQAHKVMFLKIPSATELAIKSNYLYTNHFNDLIVFDLSTTNAPRLVSRLVDAFPHISQNYPPLTNVQFECPDPSKGIVIGWEEKMIQNPKCRR